MNPTMARTLLQRTLWVVVLAVVVLAILITGLLMGVRPGTAELLHTMLPGPLAKVVFGGSSSSTFPLQQEVLNDLEQTYYEPLDQAKLQNGGVDGMLASLGDPYTVYFTPEEYASFRQHTSGQYSGVGMSVELKGPFVTIVTVFKGSPAEQGGMKPGDLIMAVDGKDVVGTSLEETVALIKGVDGTKVKISYYRPPANSGVDLTTVPDAAHLPEGGTTTEKPFLRKTIEVPVVETKALTAGTKKAGYIQYMTFSENSSVKLRAAVQAAVDAKDDAVILDLRHNGGGLLNEAVDVASLFIDKGVIVTTQGLHSSKEVYTARGGDSFNDMPLYVLVDEFTASASEIVSGALQDDKRATLVGTTTFGKGLVQTVIDLSNGGGLKVTTAVYLTPSGRDINKKGIAPDVKAPDLESTPTVDETLDKTLSLIAAGTK
jgi:carboxyl-terminal processing protease